ncbi:unnamed protein product [Spirodela intermedia]|uniref:Uncharacterized protein n=1 Tax=Spirodela intermedia TaxID=51605 RepID=A0A7I8JT61_SPIIN|nr:unnamed protein product [Spirodela intermedia]CAA6672941.1 unnamed protein product [Spirodela intermedia]
MFLSQWNPWTKTTCL